MEVSRKILNFTEMDIIFENNFVDLVEYISSFLLNTLVKSGYFLCSYSIEFGVNKGTAE
jgi:hypothetical protein